MKPGPKPRIEPADVLEVFETRDDRGEPLTAPEIAERLSCSRRTALNRLHDVDELASKQVGGRSRVWWLPIQNSESAGAETRAADSASEGEVAAAIEDLDLTDDQQAAVRAMFDLLAERGSARKSDFVDELYTDYPADYGTEGGWWNKLGKEALASLPGVRKPPEGRPTWKIDS